MRKLLQIITPVLRSALACLRAMVAVMPGLLLLFGCQKAPRITDNSVIVVQPGLGVSNICEIGMSFSQIQRATGDATKHGIYDGSWSWKRLSSLGRGEFVLVPSLGAVAATGSDEPVSLVEFYVQPHKEKLIPALEVSKPFRGSLGTSISFKDAAISNQQVETIFGTTSRVATNAAEALAFRRSSQSFVHRRGERIEELWYPSAGMAFVLKSNVVTSFQIFKPTGKTL
jgi:hypothetical protein